MSSMTSTLSPSPDAYLARPQLRLVTARPTTVRLTRRGRLVVLLVSLLLVFGTAFIALGGVSVATDRAGTPEPTRIVMVGDGETLWDIAGGISGDGDTREMMVRIERLNALDSTMLLAGQQLRVPTT